MKTQLFGTDMKKERGRFFPVNTGMEFVFKERVERDYVDGCTVFHPEQAATVVIVKDGVCFDRVVFYDSVKFDGEIVAVFDGKHERLGVAARKGWYLARDLARELEKTDIQ